MSYGGHALAGTLYISDLDGTLLGDDAELSPLTLATLHDLLLDGLLFTVASARSSASIRRVLRGLPLRLPVIEFNGGCDHMRQFDLVARGHQDEIRQAGHV